MVKLKRMLGDIDDPTVVVLSGTKFIKYLSR